MPVMLYQDQGGPNDLALDDSYVYWASYSSGLIQRMPKEGGNVQVLTQVPRLGGPEIDVDDTNLYFVATDSSGNRYLAYVPKGGAKQLVCLRIRPLMRMMCTYTARTSIG
jgi:hypothetical protein